MNVADVIEKKENYLFKLAPAYCLFNGAAVRNQNGAEISFLIENPEDEVLKGRLKRAFINHLEYIKGLENCPEIFRNLPEITFEAGKRSEIRNYVSRMYKSQGDFAGHDEDKALDGSEGTAAAVILLDTILEDARKKSATDVHIEKGCVRFRVCGKLESYIDLQIEKGNELVQRIKLLAGMNVIERRKSQDGHFVYGNKSPLFIRVSSMPVYDEVLLQEESLVLRIIDTSRLPLDLTYLGFNEKQLELIEEMENLKNGLVLVCGPTGSGKSTTVASVLTEIGKKDFGGKKIVSLEDPPEYVIPGVCQVRVNDGKKSFSDALMHVFRQDPDIIMIGEIRDEASAETAVRAAMTGHLVFATVHTVSAGEAVLRLENLGVDRKLIASVLQGVICQELEFIDDNAQLFADVAVPDEEFGMIQPELGAEELDALFIHADNYEAKFFKSLAVMGKNYKEGRPVRRIWNGGRNDKKTDRRLG